MQLLANRLASIINRKMLATFSILIQLLVADLVHNRLLFRVQVQMSLKRDVLSDCLLVFLLVALLMLACLSLVRPVSQR